MSQSLARGRLTVLLTLACCSEALSWLSAPSCGRLISGYKAVFHEHEAMLSGAVVSAAIMTISVYCFGRILGNSLFCVWTAGKAAAAG